MAIISGNEPDSSNASNEALGLYYYFIGSSNVSNATYLGYAPTIQTITYNPFIELNDINVYEANFDTDRYGKPDGVIPKCYRLASTNIIEKLLGEIKLFSTKDDNILGEPKMECYPFKYFLVTDYINNPLLIKPELVGSNNNKIRVKVITIPTSQMAKYNIYVENYKNDAYGNLEGIINNTSLMLPVSSSTYSQFLATSSASFNQGNINAMLENDVSLKQGLARNELSYQQSTVNNILGGGSSLIGGVASLFTGNVGGVVNGAMGVVGSGINQYYNSLSTQLANSQLNEMVAIKDNAISSMANAKITDMLNTPRALKTTGNDTLFNLVNSRRKIDIIEYEPTTQYKNRLKNYFIRYGYNVNNYSTINLNTRKYFNYVKTSICNISSSKIPIKHLEELKQIFNSGVTVWHIENGVEIGDYSVCNSGEGNIEV